MIRILYALSLWCLIPLFAQTPPALTIDPLPEMTQATQITLAGTVDPVDTALTIGQTPVTVAADGSFSQVFSLEDGYNNFFMRAEHPTRGLLQRSLVFYRDTQAPRLQFTDPSSDHAVNRADITISGTVRDDWDQDFELRRDGTLVPVTNGLFRDGGITLSAGDNSFTYTVSDRAGNRSSETITLAFNDQPPTPHITAPTQVAAGETFPLTVAFDQPDDITAAKVLAGDATLHQADNGQTFATTLTATANQATILISVEAEDRYGNRAVGEQVVQLHHPAYVHGRVLDHTNSLPLTGVSLRLTTPLESRDLVTDGEGRYQATLTGSPLVLAVIDPAYVAARRRVETTGGSGRRLTDLRLSPRGPPQSLSLPFQNDQLDIRLQGFSGSARITPLAAQAMPALLPLGWVPLAGFEVADTTGTGNIQVGFTNLPGPVPAGSALHLFQNADDGWRLLQTLTGPNPSAQINGVANSSFVLAAAEPGIRVPAPAGTVRRDRDHVLRAAELTQVQVDPEAVSLLQTPRTTVSLSAKPTAVSGSWARVHVLEQHQLRSGSSDVPEHFLDIQLFRNPFAPQAVPMQGAFAVQSRRDINPEQTNSAFIKFTAYPGTRRLEDYRFQNVFELDELALDFGAGGDQRPISLVRHTPADLPLIHGAQTVFGFQLNVGDADPFQPVLSFDYPARQAMILLRQSDQGDWAFVGTLTRDNDRWRNDDTTVVDTDGWYALVALDLSVGTIAGRTLFDNNPLAAVVLRSPSHPWIAESNADGSYQFLLPTWDQTQTITALHPATGYNGTRDLPAVDAPRRDGVDINLTRARLALVRHTPAAGEIAVPTWAFIDLEFSQALAWDTALLAQQVRLTGPAGAVPLRFTNRLGYTGLRLKAAQALLAETEYRVSLSPDLTAASGDRLEVAGEFTFTTHARTEETPLRLDPWFLAHNGTTLQLNIPAETVPARAKLVVLNLDTAWSSTETLTGGAMVRDLAGDIGDRIQIEVTTPGGAFATRLLDTVKTGANRFVLGARPFDLQLADGITLQVDTISNGFGRELSWRLADGAELSGLQNNLVASTRATGPLLAGVELRALDGDPLPFLEGRIAWDLTPYQSDLTANPDHLLTLREYLDGIQAPTDPRNPQTIAGHSIAQLLDIQPIPSETNDPGKRSLARTVFLGMTLGGLGSYALLGMELHPANTFTANLYTLREERLPAGVNLTDHQLAWAEAGDWFIPQNFTEDNRPFRPIKYAPIYELFEPAGQPEFRLVAMSDKTGRTRITTVPAVNRPRLYAQDPVSNAVTFMSGLSTGPNIRGHVAYNAAALLVWPEASEPGDRVLDSVKFEYKVVDYVLKDDTEEAVVNEAETNRLVKLGKFQVDQKRGIRVTLTSKNLNIRTAQFSAEFLAPTQVAPNDSGKDVVYEYRAFPDNRTFVTLTTTFETEVGQPRTTQRKVWLIHEGLPPGSDPLSPPTVTGSLPADKDRDVAVVDAVQVSFSEPVSRINRETVRLKDSEDRPVTLLFETAAGAAVAPGDYVTELFVRPEASLRMDETYELEIRDLEDHDNVKLEITDPAGMPSNTFKTTFTTQEADPFEIAQTPSNERAFASYRNLLIQVKQRSAEARGRTGFTIEIIEPGKADEPWKVLDSHEIKAPTEIKPHIAFISAQARNSPEGGEIGSLEAPGLEPVKSLPHGSLIALLTWDTVAAINRFYLFEYDGEGFHGLGRHTLISPGIVEDIAAHGPFLIFGHAGFNDGGEPIGRIEVRDVRRYLEVMETIREAQVSPVLQSHQFKYAFIKAGLSARYFYPRAVFDLAPLYHIGEEEEHLAFTAASLWYPGIGTLKPGEDSFLSPEDTWWDQRLLTRTLYPPQAPFQAPPADQAPGRRGGTRLRTAVLQQVGVRDGSLFKDIDIALFTEIYGSTESPKSNLHLYEIPRQKSAREADEPKLPRVTLQFPSRIVNIATDHQEGLIALTLSKGLKSEVAGHHVVLMDIRAVYGALQATQTETLVVSPESEFIMAEFGAEEGSAVGFSLFFHEGSVYWTNAEETLYRQPVAPVARREVGWLSYDMTAWSQDPDEGTEAPNPFQRQTTVILQATDLERDQNDTGRVQTEQVTRTFTTEVGTFQVQLYPKEELKLVFRCLEPRWEKTFETKAGVTSRMVSVNTREISLWLGDAAIQTLLRERGLLAFEVDVEITHEAKTRVAMRYPFVLDYVTPPTNDPYRYYEGVDLVSRTPVVSATDTVISSRDPRLSLATRRYHHQDLGYTIGTFGVGMRDSNAIHLGTTTWFRPGDIPEGYNPLTALKAHQRVIVGQPGLWREEASLEENGNQANFRADPLSKLKRDGNWQLEHQETMRSQWHTRLPLPVYSTLFARLNQEQSGFDLFEEDTIEEQDRLVYPLMRFQSTTDMPGAAWGRVVEQERVDLPWGNRIERRSDKKLQRALPVTIAEQTADPAPLREVKRAYGAYKVGRLVRNVHFDGFEVDYVYDPDGYLTEVHERATKDTEVRTTTYHWESLDIKAGKLELKRLISIEGQTNDGPLTLAAWTYRGPRDATLQTFSNPYCAADTTYRFTRVNGETQSVTVPSCDGVTPPWTVTFDTTTQRRLSKTWRRGEAGGSLTWERLALEEPFDWRLTADTYRDQRFTYDQLGRTATESIDGFLKTWTYQESEHFKFSPASLSYNPGHDQGQTNIQFKKEAEGARWVITDTTSPGSPSVTQDFSPSGVPIRRFDITGIPTGAETSQSYFPKGGDVKTFTAANQKINLKTGQQLSHTTTNRWGQTTSATYLDAKTTLTYDPLGRLVQEDRTKDGGARILRTYTVAYDAGFRVETIRDESNGSVTTLRFDQRDLLRRAEVSGGPAPGGTAYQYDDHGRLTETVDTADDSFKSTVTYFGVTGTPTQETSPAGTIAYDVTNEGGILVNSATITPTHSRPDTIGLKIDAVGRRVGDRMDGIGDVAISLDAFGNPLEMQLANSPNIPGGAAKAAPDLLFSWSYQAGQVTLSDHLNRREVVTKAQNQRWVDTRVIETLKKQDFLLNRKKNNADRVIPEFGNNSDTRRYDVETNIIGKRLERKITNNESALTRRFQSDGFGYPTRLTFGNQSITTSNPHNETDGFPQTWTHSNGRGLTLARNAATQTTGITSANLSWAFDHDDRGRVNGQTDARGLNLSYAYQGASGVIDKVETTQANQAGGVLTETEAGQGISTAIQTHRTWLGDEVKTERNTTALGLTTLTRDGNEATVLVDPVTNRMGEIRNFTGESTQFIWKSHYQQVEAKGPDGTGVETFYDQNGYFLAQGVLDTGGLLTPTLSVERDAAQRIKVAYTAEGTLRYTYDDVNLVQVDHSDGTSISYDYDANQTQPKTITQSRGGQVQETVHIEYHENGNPKCVTVETAGRPAESFHYSTHGDLVRHQRAHQPSTLVSFNAWGVPKELNAGGTIHQLFRDGDSSKLNFPNDVTIDINARGLLEQIGYPGLAPKRFQYDADGRLTDMVEGANHIARSLQWQNGRVTRITATPPATTATGGTLPAIPAEDLVPAYDSDGRLVQLDRIPSGDVGLPSRETLTYATDTDDLSRIERYQDGNGVTQIYGYRNNRLTNLTIENGPSFVFSHDDGGNIDFVAAGGLSARYTNWESGFPTNMQWGDGTNFQIGLDGQQRLTHVQTSDQDFALQITYKSGSQIDGCGNGADYQGALIDSVTRAGPELREILTPEFNPGNQTLRGVSVERHIGERAPPANTDPEAEPTYETLSFQEDYGSGEKQLLQQLSLVLSQEDPDNPGQTRQVQLRKRAATGGDGPRVNQLNTWNPSETIDPTQPPASTATLTYSSANGNLEQISAPSLPNQEFAWDGERRLRAMRKDGRTYEYAYDSGHRRIRAATSLSPNPLVFSYHGSKLIAVGVNQATGIRWTHAVAHGPMGPAFIVDLENQNNSYYIFNDHLGTPFAYKRLGDDKVFYTPSSPYGEDWWQSFEVPEASRETTNTAKATNTVNLGTGFERPPFALFNAPFLGLGGHMRDEDTGLIYMHHRYYSPELGHFLNPDFRAPNIYDPTTFTEPYAYAAGNPIMFWDPNGLATGIFFDGTNNKPNDETNVWRLYLAYNDNQKYYAYGIGSGFHADGTPYSTFDGISLEEKATGNSMEERVQDMLNNLENELRKGDKVVDVFGFSRGAASATLFLNKIQSKIDAKDELYKDIKVRFVTLFDQVPSKRGAIRQTLGSGADYLGAIVTLKFWQPNSYARNANNEGFTLPKNMTFIHQPIHLISIDEQRKEFAVSDLQGALQVGFRGVHSNVGGGYGGSIFEFIARQFVIDMSEHYGLTLWDETKLASMGEDYRETYEQYKQYFYIQGRGVKKRLKDSPTDNGKWYFNDGEYRHLPKNLVIHPSAMWFSEKPKNPMRYKYLKLDGFSIPPHWGTQIPLP
ncbi:phospholipase effector Tle1 domain-containing protein [Acanthopleuribacter pedis]|uniref:DUF2235 domain-containing protein n=1 Tax=Acanthopleuribacter pedis TaxID=442870 RepID=A0A8J7U7B5_9BACT|nr:DUF2235 domain-containing protein [Acanthopleuribacter pedis]MBO1322333.1 DUF2235 domain-containing protein [Acanthopleuribacter pedis]